MRGPGAARLLAALCSLHLASAAYLQWSTFGDYVNFPFGSLSPAQVSRVDGSPTDNIVVVTNSSSSGWTLTSFDAATGSANWTATLASPDGSNGALSTLTSGVPLSQQADNMLSMLFMQLGSTVVAVDPATGTQLWQHATYNQSTPTITGHSGPTGSMVYLTTSTWDYSKPVPTAINYVQALDASSGQLLWGNATAPAPSSGLPTSDTAAAYGMTALPGLAVYAQGPRLFGLSAATGKPLWSIVVSAGASTGLASNVTSVVYVAPKLPSRPYPLLLLQSTTWEQMRFMAYKLNGSEGQPPVVAWQMSGQQNFEGTVRTELATLGLQVPQVDALDALFLFWSNRTAYDPASGKPVYNSFMVARSAETGMEVWAKNITAMGLGSLPVSQPVVHNGVASFMTETGLSVWQADSGTQRFAESTAPVQPQAAGGPYSYVPTTTFADKVGQLAVVRCLGVDQPGSLCVYGGYDKRPSAAWRRQPLSAAQAALAAALMAAAWLAL